MSKKNLKQIQNIFLYFMIKSYTRKKALKILWKFFEKLAKKSQKKNKKKFDKLMI